MKRRRDSQLSVATGVSGTLAFRARTCSIRVATAATATPRTSTRVNGVHGKCGVVNSVTKFCAATSGVPLTLAMSCPASSVTRSKRGAVGAGEGRARHQHRGTRKLPADLGGDVPQRSVDGRVLVEHDELEVDALLLRIGDDLGKPGVGRDVRRTDAVGAQVGLHQVHAHVGRRRCGVLANDRAHLRRNEQRHLRNRHLPDVTFPRSPLSLLHTGTFPGRFAPAHRDRQQRPIGWQHARIRGRLVPAPKWFTGQAYC